MPRSEFRTTNDPFRPFKLSGSLLNREHGVLNAYAGKRQASHQGVRTSGVVDADTLYPPTILGVAKITNAAATCANSENFGETVDAPCSSSDLYLAQFRYRDPIDKEWKQYDEDLPLDASVYFESDPTDASQSPVGSYPTVRAGGIPQYVRGDVVCAYWDELRNMLVPIQSPYQDVVQAEFISRTTMTVPTVSGQQQGPFDSAAEVYLEIKRPTDQDWIALSALSWRVPYIDSLREYRDSRAGFCLFAAPHGTYIRMRAIRSSADVIYGTNWSQIRFFGAGRKSIAADFVPYSVFRLGGGSLIGGWMLRADTLGRFRDSPGWNAIGSVFQITYGDPLDEWIIGAHFSTVMYNDLGQRNLTPTDLTVVTSIDCEGGFISEYCQRTITFPAEFANRMTIGDEVCYECGLCTYQAPDGSQYSDNFPSLDPNWHDLTGNGTWFVAGGQLQWFAPMAQAGDWTETLYRNTNFNLDTFFVGYVVLLEVDVYEIASDTKETGLYFEVAGGEITFVADWANGRFKWTDAAGDRIISRQPVDGDTITILLKRYDGSSGVAEVCLCINQTPVDNFAPGFVIKNATIVKYGLRLIANDSVSTAVAGAFDRYRAEMHDAQP